MTPPRLTRRSTRVSLLLMLVMALAGCDGLLSPSNRMPREARVVVTGTSPVQLRLITSTDFTAEQDLETGIYHINFSSSEVRDGSLPMERTVRLNTDRFMARVLNVDGDQTANVTLQVWFDRDLVYSQEAALRDAFVDFIHVFF
jgi:hypothetical protein